MLCIGTNHHVGDHTNAFGFLRLLFASLVVVAHTPELVDGNRSREILTLLTGTISFGELAVNGFFIISGFLITSSFVRANSIGSYLALRAARIYPAFIVASLISIVVVGRLGGGFFDKDPLDAVLAAAARLAVLARPAIVGAFPDQHHSGYDTALNGAMWTLQYELLCYLLVVPLVAAGALRRPALLSLAAMVSLLLADMVPETEMLPLSTAVFLPASTATALRLMGMFLAGAAFYAWRGRIALHPWMIIVSVLGLVATSLFDPIVEIGFAAFGGYLIFATAAAGTDNWLGRINNRNDISYGLYVYAWPTQRLLMLCLPDLALPLLGVLTWGGATLLAMVSWFVVERPTMRWARTRLNLQRYSAPTYKHNDQNISITTASVI